MHSANQRAWQGAVARLDESSQYVPPKPSSDALAWMLPHDAESTPAALIKTFWQP